MKLIRGQVPEKGTYGTLFTEDEKKICCTIEREWLNNEPYISCVPDGVYELVEYKSPRFGKTFALVNHDLGVGLYQGDAKRYAILFHAANKPDQLQGCIAPVLYLNTRWGGNESKIALNKVLKYLMHTNDRFLEIQPAHCK